MARVFIDGFESGDFSLWRNVLNVSSVTGYTGYGAYLTGGARMTRDLPASSTYYFAFKVKFASSSTLQFMHLCETDLLEHIEFRGWLTGGLLGWGALRGGTWIAYGQNLSFNVWYHFEIYVYIADSSGRLVVKVNGETQIDFTGDTRNGGASGVIDNVYLGYNVWSTNVTFDDFVVDNANWVGNTRIAGLVPNGAGNSTQWDPSAGSNYDCVDEVPPSDADYVSTNVVDEVDTYALSDLPAEAVVVRCVQVMARAQKEGAATPQNLNLAVRTTGGDAYSADQALQTAFKGHAKLWETNPGTTNPWTVSEVNAMEAGVKSKT